MYQLTLPYRSVPLRHIRAGTQGRNLGGCWYRGCGVVLLPGLFSEACSACFLSDPRTASELAPCHINQQSRKCTTGLPSSQSGGNIFSVVNSLLQSESSFCHIDMKTSWHIYKHLAFPRPTRGEMAPHLDICARLGETRPQAKRNLP